MTYRVLLVEDDKMVQAINQDYVNQTDHFKVEKIVATYSEAQTALHEEVYDLILIDDDLGADSKAGSALLKDIRALDLDCAVIMLTAQDSPHIIQEGLNYGVHDYILKPFSYQRLKSSLDRLAQKFHLLDQDRKLSQAELDQLYMSEAKADSTPEKQALALIEGPLEKGITPATLEIVLQAIEEVPAPFTIAELLELTGISHVTIRKYIHFLTKKNYLKTQQEYGQTGRPTIYYLKNNR